MINQPLSAIATYARASQRLMAQPDSDPGDVLAALEPNDVGLLQAPHVPAPLRAAAGSGSVLAPIPGLILDIKVTVGESVVAGQSAWLSRRQ